MCEAAVVDDVGMVDRLGKAMTRCEAAGAVDGCTADDGSADMMMRRVVGTNVRSHESRNEERKEKLRLGWKERRGRHTECSGAAGYTHIRDWSEKQSIPTAVGGEKWTRRITRQGDTNWVRVYESTS